MPLGDKYGPRVRNHIEIRLVRPRFLRLDLSNVVITNYSSTDLGDLHLRKVLSGTRIITTAELKLQGSTFILYFNAGVLGCNSLV